MHPQVGWDCRLKTGTGSNLLAFRSDDWARSREFHYRCSRGIMYWRNSLVDKWSMCQAARTQDRQDLFRAKQSPPDNSRSEEHTSELQSRGHLVCRLLLEKKNE